MASLKALKGRIASVKSTQKITKAMKTVAAAKLRRATETAVAGRPYAQRLEAVMASLAGKVVVGPNSPRLLAGTGRDQVHLIVVATGERGLAGGFNANIVKLARRRAQDLEAQGKTVRFYLVGRKGRVIKRFYPQGVHHDRDMSEIKKPGFEHARAVADDLIARYEAGEYDVAHLIYSTFRSALVQEPTEQQIIPVQSPRLSKLDVMRTEMASTVLSAPREDLVNDFQAEGLPRADAEQRADERRRQAEAVLTRLGMPLPSSQGAANAAVEYEPEEEEILAALLPRNVAIQIYRAMLENNAGFYGAQMTAMDNATRNAGDMIQRLSIEYNRSRQAAITKELIEIISGAEAL